MKVISHLSKCKSKESQTTTHLFSYTESVVLTSADNTSQFFLAIIWRAGQTIAVWLHLLKEGSWITASIKSWDRLRIFINTFIHCTTVTTVFSHEVPNILHCPVSGTLCLGRNHHSGGHIAHSTGNIVSAKRIERWKLSIDIFYSTNRTTSYGTTPSTFPPGLRHRRWSSIAERMVAFPLGKLVYLGVKQLSKPISIQLRSSAAKHPFVSKYICAPPAHCE